MTTPSFADLFEPRPSKWGLRGDPTLGDALIKVFHDHPLPRSQAALRTQFDVALQALTGHALADVPQTLTLSALKGARGGMSNGTISGPFWRDTALPLILARYNRAVH